MRTGKEGPLTIAHTIVKLSTGQERKGNKISHNIFLITTFFLTQKNLVTKKI